MSLEGTRSTSDTLATTTVDASIDVTKIDSAPPAITPGLAAHKAATSDLKTAAKVPAPEPAVQENKTKSSCGKCTLF